MVQAMPKEDLLLGALSGTFIALSGALYALLRTVITLEQSNTSYHHAYGS